MRTTALQQSGESNALNPTANRVGDYATLIKLRVLIMVAITALGGAYLGWRGSFDGSVILAMIEAMVGTSLVAGGANVLNQWWERRPDSLMDRTRNRPLPSGRINPAEALLFGLLISVVGIVHLSWRLNLLAGGLAALSLILYVLAYTPLKRVSWLSLQVGAVPGALPPVIGWTAMSGRLDAGALAVFAILFVWQMPHFLSIAWMYRQDYTDGGYRVLSVDDPEGRRTGRHILLFTLVLIGVSIWPYTLGMGGGLYLTTALVMGAMFLVFGIVVAATRQRLDARRHMIASLVYLPALFGALAVCKWGGI
jgi:protoheme IX farnesyltransferase